jgi:galactonate dehydratase
MIAITAIKAMQVRGQGTFIKVETDAGISGFGECHATGPLARSAIGSLEGGRLPHLGLIGKDPLAIGVHFHNMFAAYPQRGRQVRALSGIDIALWDLAGKLLGQPVSKLLGGNFRSEIPLYSHCPGGDFLSSAEWRARAQVLRDDPQGFRAFKVDIHHALGIPMQQAIPSITPGDAHRVRQAYELAREALGPDIDIIVHCHCELDVSSAIRVAAAIEGIDPLFYEDPIAPTFSEAWVALRRSTRLPIMTGENMELAEAAIPFLQNSVVDALQPDLINSGGITGTKMIADLADLYRIPICLHNVSGLALWMASQQLAAAVFNCPMIECKRGDEYTRVAVNAPPPVRDGRMQVSDSPGLGLDLDQEFLKATREEGEPWWG